MSPPMVRSRSRWLAPWLGHAVLVLMAILLGCEDAPSAPGPAPPRPRPPAVAAPAGLLAELSLGRPQTTWNALRQAAGGPLLLLPRSLGGLWVNVLGLPLRAVSEFDERRPLVGAIVHLDAKSGKGSGRLGLALAARVRSGQRFIAQTSMGSEASYTAAPPDDDGLVRLRPRRSETAARRGIELELGVVDDYAVFGLGAGALEHAGAYVARTLSQRPAADWRVRPVDRLPSPSAATAATTSSSAAAPAPSSPPPSAQSLPDVTLRIDGAALKGPWLGWLEGGLNRLRANADDTWEAMLDAEGLQRLVLELLPDLDGLDVALRVSSSALTLTAALRPAAGAAADRLGAIPTSEPARLLALPDDCVLAATWIEGAASRQQGASRSTDAIAAMLGSDVAAEDVKMLRRALENVAAGRGDETVAGVRCTGAGVTGFAHGGVADPKRMKRGVKALTELRRHRAVVGRLKAASLKLQVKTLRLPNLPLDVERLRLSSQVAPPAATDGGAPTAADMPPSGDPIDLLLALGSKHYWLTAGLQARETLLQLHQPDPERTLAHVPAALPALRALGARVWFAALLDPLAMASCRAGTPGSGPIAPVTIAGGPSATAGPPTGWLLLDVPTPVLQAAIRHLDR